MNDRMPDSANCTPIAITISPMKRVTVACTKPPLPLPSRRAASTIKSHITVVATATSALTGIPDFPCATESAMTPVIVSGLALWQNLGLAVSGATRQYFHIQETLRGTSLFNGQSVRMPQTFSRLKALSSHY